MSSRKISVYFEGQMGAELSPVTQRKLEEAIVTIQGEMGRHSGGGTGRDLQTDWTLGPEKESTKSSQPAN